MVSSSMFHDNTLDEASLKAAMRAINESVDSRARGLQILKEKVLKTEHLKCRLDDDFLLRFLRVAKFDPSRAYDRLHRYLYARKKYPKIFGKFLPSATTSAHGARHVWASPVRAEDHSAVVVHKRALYNPSTMVFEEMFTLDLLVMDHLTTNQVNQVCGITVVLDFAGYGWQHFIADTPKRLRMALDSFQNTFPLRFKDIHVVNAPSLFTLVYNLAYPFLSKKIRSRVHVHSSKEDLAASLPLDILPEEYGGKIPQSKMVDLVEEVVQKEDYFREQLQYGYRRNPGSRRSSVQD